MTDEATQLATQLVDLREVLNDATATTIKIISGKGGRKDDGTPFAQTYHYSGDHFEFKTIRGLFEWLEESAPEMPENPTEEQRAAVKAATPYLVPGWLHSGGSTSLKKLRQPTGVTSQTATPENDPNYSHRRRKENIGAGLLLPFDLDVCPPSLAVRLMHKKGILSGLAGIVYHTPSSTQHAPRVRMLIQTNREITPDEKQEFCLRFEHWLMKALGATFYEMQKPGFGRWDYKGKQVLFDRSVYRAVQMLYAGPKNFPKRLFEGAPVAIDELPEHGDALQLEPARKGKATPQEAATAAGRYDEIGEWLRGSEYFLDEDDRAIYFEPHWSSDYSSAPTGAGDRRVCWFKPGTGNFHEGHFKSMHSSDAGMSKADWLDKLRYPFPEFPNLEPLAAPTRGYEVTPSPTPPAEPETPQNAAEATEPQNAAPVSLYSEEDAPDPVILDDAPLLPGGALDKVGDNVIAQYALSALGLAAADEEAASLYVYQDSGADAGCWKRKKQPAVQQMVMQVFESRLSNYSINKINSITKILYLKARTIQPPVENVLSFANGVLNIETGEFKKHHPGYWLRHNNGIEYTPAREEENLAIDAPVFADWLAWVAEGNQEKAEAIQAALYAVLMVKYDWELFFELTGEGGSGKGVMMALCRLLVGEQNVGSSSITAFDNARERAPIADKKLILLPDQPAYAGDGSGLRAITGGDLVHIDPKWDKPFDTIIRAMVVTANNTPMIFTEKSGGTERRRVIFWFNNAKAESERDPFLKEKMRVELPVIVRHLLNKYVGREDEAKKALHRQRRSTEAVKVKVNSDPLVGFVEHLNFHPEADKMPVGGFVHNGGLSMRPQTYLYHAYLAFLSYNGYKQPLTLRRFVNDIKQAARTHGGEWLTSPIRKKMFGKPETLCNVTLKDSAAEFIADFFPDAVEEDPRYGNHRQ